MTTARRLLADIDPLPYPARQRLLARLARDSVPLRSLLDELHAQVEHRAFARRVALQLACMARDHGHLERCLSEPDTELVRIALAASVRLGLPPAVLVARVPTLPPTLRGTVYQAIRRYRATGLAEELLPVVRERFGDREAAALLPACGPSTVAGQLPALGYAVSGWAGIGHRHPGVLLDYLDAELAAAPRSAWQHCWERLGAGIAAAVPAEPERIMVALERSAPHVTPPAALAAILGALARHDPARLLRILLDPRRTAPTPGGPALWRAVREAGDAELTGLGRTLATTRLDRFLHTLPPARRAAIYTGIVGTRDLVSAGVGLAALDQLPAEARTREARRLLALRPIVDDPSLRLAVTARLPWAQASPALREATTRSTAGERAEAYPLYVNAAAATRDREVFTALLGSLGRLANEQDPVRLAALRALSEVPPWLYRANVAEPVTTLITDAVRARDCSWQTQVVIRELCTRLIRQGATTRIPELVDAGLRGLELLGQKSSLGLRALDHALPLGAEHEVFEALRERITIDAKRGDYTLALGLASGLGRRAYAMPKLQEFVSAARTAADDHTVREAIRLWLRPPATRDERIEQTFLADRSTITLPEVCDGIALRRTDLLDTVFGKPLHGRFLKKNVGYVPPFHRGFARWLPRHTQAYADLLTRVASARRVPDWERVSAVRRLGRVPGTAGRLRGYLDHRDITVVEAALSALAWTDEPGETLPTLLSYADTDRARVAMYAAGRCARYLTADRLGELLSGALATRKVTSRKEIVRLLGEHQAGDAAGTLTAVWFAPDQHRDVRRAVVSACRWLLDDERAWTLLGHAAGAEHAVSTAVLEFNPTTLAERHRARYALLVHTIADAANEDTARLGLAALARWSRWDPAGTAILVDRISDLNGTARWRTALHTLIAGCVNTEDPEPLRGTATRLLRTSDQLDPDRDQPARQRLLALADEVRAAGASSPVLRDAAAALTEVMAGDPTLRRVAVELAVAGANLTAPDGGLRRAAELADQAVWAWHAHHALRTRLRPVVTRLPQPHLLAIAERLAKTDGPQALLALAIANAAGPESGWTQPWRTLVHTLRQHPDDNVRLGALDTFTNPE